MATQTSAIDAAQITRHLERVVASRVFARAGRSQRFLRYLVEEAMSGRVEAAKEYTIAIEVFDRDAGYDPAVDATVRVEAGRLRSRLRDYYAEEGSHDELLLSLPKGGYRLTFVTRAAGELAKEAFGDVALEAWVAAPLEPGLASSAEQRWDGARKALGETDSVIPTGSPGLEPMQASRGTRRNWSLKLAAWLLPLTIASGYVVWRLANPQRLHAKTRTMAVLPFKNLSGDPGQDYFADGTTDELITELASVPELRVVSWNSTLQERDTRKPLREIAAELHADVLVEGSVVRSGETVRINTQLIDTATDTHLWASSFAGEVGEMLALETRAAQEIVAHARLGVASAVAPAAPVHLPPALDPAAHEAYLRGRNYLDKRQGAESAKQFQLAIDRSPAYAPAYTGLSMALESEALLGEDTPDDAIPKAMAAVGKSLTLDPENGDALIARGSLETSFLWQWESAERDLTRGLVLSPNNSFGHMMLSVYMDSVGRPDDAVKQMQAAVEIDPLSFFMARHYGSTLFYARRYGEALHQLLYAREMHPASALVVDSWISSVYEKQGLYDSAIQYDLLRSREASPGAPVQQMLAAYRQKGWQAYWMQRLEVLQRGKDADPCHQYFLAVAAIRARRQDEALSALKQAAEGHCYWMGLARADPLLDEVRGDPGFAEVLASLHLPASAR